jgi:selenocysteine lyase/cysteine desulfurase
VLGNPHSLNPSSILSTQLVEQARQAILHFFNASADEYVVIFSQNASGALKLVGESFPFSANSQYLLTYDNHNSVNGLREFARRGGAKITYIPVSLPEMRVEDALFQSYIDRIPQDGQSLFAFPAQSNFSGTQHPLEWIEKAQAKGWLVLLDAAAFVATNPLDLSRWHPDFVPISFYKMMGYPTGVGCLLARKQALARLHRPWFAGGTITVASVQGDKYYLAPGEAAFEEGTINYLNIPAVEIGFNHIQAISLHTIHTRVQCLTGWLVEHMLELGDGQGRPGIHIYGPVNTNHRGGTISFNFFDPSGHAIDHRQVERFANQANISLRTGCFCNPGAGEVALELSKPELMVCFARSSEQLSLDEFRVCMDGKSSGAVRISVGIASNFTDVFHFMEFARKLVGESRKAL